MYKEQNEKGGKDRKYRHFENKLQIMREKLQGMIKAKDRWTVEGSYRYV